MRIIDLRRFESAVTSITTCTAPTVQVGNLLAKADRLGSPYKSRRHVFFMVAEERLPQGVIAAWNTRHAIQVATLYRLEEYTPAPRPTERYVGEWIEATIPFSHIQAVFSLAREFFGEALDQPSSELVQAWVLAPRLAGWHYSRPVFYLAATEGNEVFRISLSSQEDVLQQGNLKLIPTAAVAEHYLLPQWGGWGGEDAFFNHVLGDGGPEPTASCPVAVNFEGEIVCALVVSGPVRIISQDHDAVNLPAGSWVALHPFPRLAGAD